MASCRLSKCLQLCEAKQKASNPRRVASFHAIKAWMKGSWGELSVSESCNSCRLGVGMTFHGFFPKKKRVGSKPVLNPLFTRTQTVLNHYFAFETSVVREKPSFYQPVPNPYRPHILPVPTHIFLMGSTTPGILHFSSSSPTN